MGKQRQKRNSSKKRINPLQRKRVEAGIKQAASNVTTLSADQVTPVIQKVKKKRHKLCKM